MIRSTLGRWLTLGLLLSATLFAASPARTLAGDAVINAEAAHAAVVADGAPFDGWRQLSSGMIGQSQYWEASLTPDGNGDWAVVYTYGWGDCPAGCIDRHSWSFTVAGADGAVVYVGESGPELPADAPAALRAYPDALPSSSPTPVPTASPAPVTVGGPFDLAPLLLIGLPLALLGLVLLARRPRGA